MSGKQIDASLKTDDKTTLLVALGFHVAAAYVTALGWWWIHTMGWLGWHLLPMFTMWNCTLVVIHFLMSAVQDLVTLRKSGSRLITDRTVTSVSFHVSMVSTLIMSVIFWSLYFWKRELIIPASLHMPMRTNIVLHAWPVLGLILDLQVTKYAPGPLQAELVALLLYASLYVGGQVTFKLVQGRFPYPFMQNMLAHHYISFISVSVGSGVLLLKASRSFCQRKSRLLDLPKKTA